MPFHIDFHRCRNWYLAQSLIARYPLCHVHYRRWMGCARRDGEIYVVGESEWARRVAERKIQYVDILAPIECKVLSKNFQRFGVWLYGNHPPAWPNQL
jgi:hypothetical protein